MKIKKRTAIKLFNAIGFKTAEKWDIKRLQDKIKNLPNIADDVALSNEKAQDLLNRVLSALNKCERILVYDPDDVAGEKERTKAVEDAKVRAEEVKKEKIVKTEKKEKRSTKRRKAKEKRSQAMAKRAKERQKAKDKKKESGKQKAKAKGAMRKQECKKKKAGKTQQIGTKKPGIIMSVLEFITNSGPISKEQILAKLRARFPDRDPKSMERTIPRVPNHLSREKGIDTIEKNDKGRYYIKKSR